MIPKRTSKFQFCNDLPAGSTAAVDALLQQAAASPCADFIKGVKDWNLQSEFLAKGGPLTPRGARRFAATAVRQVAVRTVSSLPPGLCRTACSCLLVFTACLTATEVTTQTPQTSAAWLCMHHHVVLGSDEPRSPTPSSCRRAAPGIERQGHPVPQQLCDAGKLRCRPTPNLAAMEAGTPCLHAGVECYQMQPWRHQAHPPSLPAARSSAAGALHVQRPVPVSLQDPCLCQEGLPRVCALRRCCQAGEARCAARPWRVGPRLLAPCKRCTALRTPAAL